MKTYIHYGHKYFDKNKFVNIKNDFKTKPIGGFWASNVKAKYGWKDWCESEGYKPCIKGNSFEFTLSKDAKILYINNKNDLQNISKLKSQFDFSWELLDFEKIKEEYDAIEVNISNDYDLYFALYGWGCDSILIMNPDIIKVLK